MPYRVEKECMPGFDRLVNDNEKCSVLIKRFGAEVIGYDVWDEEAGKFLPILWNNGNDSIPFPGAWKNHATILFPIVGGLKNGRSRFDDAEIILPGNHGFARRSTFDLIEAKTEDSAKAIYRLSSTAETKKLYPFDFALDLIYILKGNCLSLSFKVKNIDKKILPFQFGWHPGFNTELGLGGKRSEWEISFPAGRYKQYHVLDTGDSFLTGKKSRHEFKDPFTFSDQELHCTMMYEIEIPANRCCRLYNNRLHRGVQMIFTDFPHVGFWAEKGQEYICIEPWQGMDDHEKQEPFKEKIGMMLLEPGETITRTASILPIIG